MPIDGQKNHNGKHILKLGNEFYLPLAMRVVDICRGKAHLKADDCCSKFDGGENQPGNQSQKQTEQHLGEDKQKEGEWRKIHLGNGASHNWKKHQGADKNQGGFYQRGCLGRAEHRNCSYETCNPCGYYQKGLKLIDGEKGYFHGET